MPDKLHGLNPAVFAGARDIVHKDLEKQCTAQEQTLQDMYRLLRPLYFESVALTERIQHALTRLGLFPAHMREADIPEGCPGWGMCAYEMPPCQHCPHQENCFVAGH